MAVTAAPIRPYRRLGLASTPSIKGVPSAATFKKGAPLQNTGSNTIAEWGGTRAANRTTGRIIGFAEQDVTSAGLIANASGSFPNVDFTYTPCIPGITFKGTLDDGNGARALVAADVGKAFGLTKDGGSLTWFLDSTKVTPGASGTGNTVAVVVALIDAAGSTATDTPSPTNSGKALVEFVVIAGATAYDDN
jgi:hypothetical protein